MARKKKRPEISTGYAYQVLLELEAQESLDLKTAKLKEELIELIDSRIDEDLERRTHGQGDYR